MTRLSFLCSILVHNYKLHVFTGELKGSGTDANVFITLYGENGDTGERPLTKSETYRDKFEKGHVSNLVFHSTLIYIL